MTFRIKAFICNQRPLESSVWCSWLDYEIQEVVSHEPPGDDPFDDSHWEKRCAGRIALNAPALKYIEGCEGKAPMSLGGAIDYLIKSNPEVIDEHAGPQVELSNW